MEEELYKQDESLKIIKGMAGKISYEFKLIGKPEDNLKRAKALRKDLDKLTEVEE